MEVGFLSNSAGQTGHERNPLAREPAAKDDLRFETDDENPKPDLFCGECGARSMYSGKLCQECGAPFEDGDDQVDDKRDSIFVEAAAVELPVEVVGHFSEPDEIDAADIEVTGEILGEGRFGKVKEAVLQDGHGRCVRVALKMMGAVGSADAAAFYKEIAVLRTVSKRCDRVCRLYGTCEKDGSHCIVMKRYVCSLTILMEDSPSRKLPTARVLDISQQISSALGDLHSNRVIVHDLKPANILIDENGDAVLADFGISSVIEQTLSMAAGPTAGAVKGTLNYMSPEAWDPDTFGIGGRLTKATDIWSLGCCMLEMASGTIPWQGLSQMRVMQLVTIQQEHPVISPAIDPVLAQLILECFRVDANARPSANEVRTALNKLQRQSFVQHKEPLNLRQQKLLEWVKEDQGLSRLTGTEALNATLHASFGIPASGSVVALLTRAEDLIVARTREHETDPNNEFCGGCFMSHSQGTSGPQVMLLKQRMEKMCPPLKGKIWYDKDNTPTEEGMRLGIKACPIFVLFLSSDTLRRPFVRKEIRWAMYYRKKIVLVWEKEGHAAVTEFHTFFQHTKEALDGESAPDIDVIFNDNVAIPYYSRAMFSDVSLALILRNCGYEKHGAELLRGPRISLPKKIRVHGRAAQGRLIALSVFHRKSVLYSAFVWARMALNSPKRRFLARAVLFCEANGFSQAEAARLQLEAMCPTLTGRCHVSNEVQLGPSSHVVIYVIAGVFSDLLIIDAIRQATDLSRPITCLVELDPRHGGVTLGEDNTLTGAAIGSAPMDILQPLNSAHMIPFHKDSDFRNVSLQQLLSTLQHRVAPSVAGSPRSSMRSSTRSRSSSSSSVLNDEPWFDEPWFDAPKQRWSIWLKVAGVLLIVLLGGIGFVLYRGAGVPAPAPEHAAPPPTTDQEAARDQVRPGPPPPPPPPPPSTPTPFPPGQPAHSGTPAALQRSPRRRPPYPNRPSRSRNSRPSSPRTRIRTSTRRRRAAAHGDVGEAFAAAAAATAAAAHGDVGEAFATFAAGRVTNSLRGHVDIAVLRRARGESGGS
jgi:serine/threonine protein kinase